MLRTALVENTIQLEYAERQVAKEVQQYSDVVTDLTSEKALLLINRKLAQAEEHNRQLSSQLKAKSEQLKDQAKLNDELQQLLAVKDERLEGAIQACKTMEESLHEAKRLRDEALQKMEEISERESFVPELMERKEQLEIEVTEAHKQARELQADLEKANTTMENAQQRCWELQQSNIQLQKQAEIAIATLQDEKSLNAKLQENNKELMREFKLLEESRDRLLEVAHMYKGQVGNLEERVGDLANDAANKGEYLARHQARVEQLSSVVAFQQHQARSMPGTTHTRGVSVYSVAHSGSRTPGVAAPITQASSVAPTDYSLSGLGKETSLVSATEEPSTSGRASRMQGPHGVQDPRNRYTALPSKKPIQAGIAHQLSGQPPPPLLGAPSFSACNANGAPGTASGLHPIPHDHRRPAPPGHDEWEQAMEAAVNEYTEKQASQQQAAWLAQGRGRKPSANLKPSPSNRSIQYKADTNTSAQGNKRKAGLRGMASQPAMQYVGLQHQQPPVMQGNPYQQHSRVTMQQQRWQQQQEHLQPSPPHVQPQRKPQGQPPPHVHQLIQQQNRPAQEYKAYDHNGRLHVVQTEYL